MPVVIKAESAVVHLRRYLEGRAVAQLRRALRDIRAARRARLRGRRLLWSRR